MLKNEIMNLLDTCYDRALEGRLFPGERSIVELAEDYLKKNNNREKAIDELIKYQTCLCGINGFLAGVGGMLTLPIAIPANMVGVIYVQLRMIAAIAYINGYDISSDQVRTMAYICLTGNSAMNVLKNVGIEIGEKIAVNALKKLPGAILTKINRQVGFKLLTKSGEKGTVNIIQMMPLVGGGIGGAVDAFETVAIGNIAKKMFLEE